MDELVSVVKAAQKGDVDSFGRIVERVQDMAYGYAYALLGDFHLAQDAAQEAFFEAYHNLGNLRDPAAFPGWFHRIVRYRCSHIRRKTGPTTVPLDAALTVPTSAPGPRTSSEAGEMKERIMDAVRSLPPPQREATTLFYINGYSQDEIAEFLEVPVNTVKSRLYAARRKLKERMIAMVKETFDEYKLPDDFAGRIVKGVPVLAWNRSGNTTYIAAVSAALAPTDRPFDYDSLMVYSGLAFRLRYVRRKDGREWSSVGPIGQFEEEVEAVANATGCDQPHVRSGDVADMKRRTVAAIDAGYCPFAYIGGDSGVIYGYEDDGDTVYVREYSVGERFERLSFQEMLDCPGSHHGPFFLEPNREPMSTSDALAQGLEIGLVNWRRGREPGEKWQPWRDEEKWEYIFGETAYQVWIEDLRGYESLDLEAQQGLLGITDWTAYALYDARLAAARHLAANTRLLGEKAGSHLAAASELYEKSGNAVRDLEKKGLKGYIERRKFDPPQEELEPWTTETREHLIATLTAALRLDALAIAEIEKALAWPGEGD